MQPNTNIKFLYLSMQHYSSLLIWQTIVKIIWSKYYSISNFILCCPFTDRSRETKESTIPWLSPTRWRETFKLRLILYDSNPCTPMGSEESISQYRFSSFTIKLVIFPKIGWSQNSKKSSTFHFFPCHSFRGVNWWPLGAPPTLFSSNICTTFLK